MFRNIFYFETGFLRSISKAGSDSKHALKVVVADEYKPPIEVAFRGPVLIVVST